MKVAYLPIESRAALGADVEVIVTHEDLTEATANTTQTLTFPIADKMSVQCTHYVLHEKFEDTADAAFNTTTVVIGDGGSANRFLTSSELNVNGTEVTMKNGTGTSLVYATDDTVDLVFTSMADKSLSDLNKGRVSFFFRINDGRGIVPA